MSDEDENELLKNLEDRIKGFREPNVFVVTGKITLKDYFGAYRTDELADAANDAQNPLLALEAAIKLYHEDRDAAFNLLRNSLQWIRGKVVRIPENVRYRVEYADQDIQWLLKDSRCDPSAYVFRALYESIVRPRNAWYYSTFAKELAEELQHPLRDQYYLFHALLATAQIRSDNKEAWDDFLDVLFANNPMYRRLGKTSQTVWQFLNSKFLSETFVIKATTKPRQIEQEAEICHELSEAVPEIAVPIPLRIREYPDYSICAMQLLDGETLYEQLKEGNHTAIPDAISALAKIHARYAPEGIDRLNLKEDLSAKLHNPYLKLRNWADGILRYCEPVIKALEESKLWVWNKDAHPENWIIGERVGAVDCEPRYIAPAVLDLANLLEYEDFLINKEEKKEYIQLYFEEFEKEKQNAGSKNVMREYYNAVIYRMISFASAWSDPSRERQHLRKAAIDRAISAIDHLNQEDPEYAMKGLNRICYISLQHHLSIVKGFL